MDRGCCKSKFVQLGPWITNIKVNLHNQCLDGLSWLQYFIVSLQIQILKIKYPVMDLRNISQIFKMGCKIYK